MSSEKAVAVDWAAYKRRRREQARAEGMCIVCCAAAPVGDRTICNDCNASARQRGHRIRKRRKSQRERIARSHTYEAAGDAALERLAYGDAALQYERALRRRSNTEEEILLCEKIGTAVQCTMRPERATPWLERALERRLTSAVLPKHAAHISGHLSKQCWFESRTRDAIPYFKDFLELSSQGDTEKTDAQAMQHNSWTAFAATGYLILLGRYGEAAMQITRGRRDSELLLHWTIGATQGRTKKAFSEFNLPGTKPFRNQFVVPMGLDDYANWALEFGRIDIARACRERALLIARTRRILWQIPYFTLRFVELLIAVGEYSDARHLLIDAMTYDTKTPTLRVLKAMVGVEFARTVGDRELLKKTIDDEALELAFRSGEPQRIGAIVATYVKVAAARHQMQRARDLIARGISAVTSASRVGELLSLAARYGSPADAHRARALLEQQLRLPHQRTSQAYLELWEAYAGLAQRAPNVTRNRAEKAAAIFARLGWKHQQNEALALAGVPRPAIQDDVALSKNALLGRLDSTLTKREQEVAELALRGLTNHAIAQLLLLSEYTVESHMSSILNRLGLRSRWQLMHLR